MVIIVSIYAVEMIVENIYVFGDADIATCGTFDLFIKRKLEVNFYFIKIYDLSARTVNLPESNRIHVVQRSKGSSFPWGRLT